jgi:succinyl-CoA synthetase beta subunit
MNLHEYQGKELFRAAGIPVPPGFTISTEACRAYLEAGVDCVAQFGIAIDT